VTTTDDDWLDPASPTPTRASDAAATGQRRAGHLRHRFGNIDGTGWSA